MERRQFQRKKLHLEAQVIIGSMSSSCFIDNVSERGLSLETDAGNLLAESTDFMPGTKCQIKFHTTQGEGFILNCNVSWAFRSGPHGLKHKVGMEVIFPPPAYIHFCRSLQ